MRKLKVVFMALFTVLLFSCGSDDGEPSINQADLVAKWKPVERKEYVNGTLVNSESLENLPNCPSYLEFLENNTASLVLYETTCEAPETENYTYMIDGMYFIINNEYNVLVETLTDTELVTSQSEIDNAGIEHTTKKKYEKIE